MHLGEAVSLRTALLLVALLVPACGGSEGSASGTEPSPSCLSVEPASEIKRLPVPLDDWGTVTEISERGGFIGAEAITDTLIVELYPEIVRTLDAAGYTLLGGDNEGFEAEMTFRDPRERLTTFTLSEGPCDEVIVRVLVEKGSKAE